MLHLRYCLLMIVVALISFYGGKNYQAWRSFWLEHSQNDRLENTENSSQTNNHEQEVPFVIQSTNQENTSYQKFIGFIKQSQYQEAITLYQGLGETDKQYLHYLLQHLENLFAQATVENNLIIKQVSTAILEIEYQHFAFTYLQLKSMVRLQEYQSAVELITVLYANANTEQEIELVEQQKKQLFQIYSDHLIKQLDVAAIESFIVQFTVLK